MSKKSLMATIDRIEGEFAIVIIDSGSTVDVHIELLPDGIKEGDLLEVTIINKQRKSSLSVDILDGGSGDIGL